MRIPLHLLSRIVLVAATFIAVRVDAGPVAVDRSFIAGTNGTARSLAVDSAGRVLIAGGTNITVWDVFQGTYLERVLPDGRRDETFVPIRNPTGPPLGGLIAFDDAIYASSGDGIREFAPNGEFRKHIPVFAPTSFTVDSQRRVIVTRATDYLTNERVRRYLPNGEIDRTFQVFVGCCYWEGVYSVAVQKVGEEEKILIAGTFSRVDSVDSWNIVRLNSDGTVDTSFSGSSGDRTLDILVLPDGRIRTAGYGFVKGMLADGRPDPAFPGSYSGSDSIWFQKLAHDVAGGGLFVAGYHFGPSQNPFVRRFDEAGHIDQTFRVAVQGYDVSSRKVDSSGSLLFSGRFEKVNCEPKSGVVRLVSVPDPISLPCVVEPKPEPELATTRARWGKITCCWPTNYPEYTLQATRRLRPRQPDKEKWVTVTNTPVEVDGSLCVTNRAIRWGRHYRLVRTP